jgi:hypothetical protein
MLSSNNISSFMPAHRLIDLDDNEDSDNNSLDFLGEMNNDQFDTFCNVLDQKINKKEENINEIEKDNINLLYKHDIYEIFCLLPKQKRKELICKDMEEDFKKRKREIKMDKYKYKANIKIFNKILKYKLNKELKEIKERPNDLIDDINCLEKEFMYLYNNNLTQCKDPKCKEKCGRDISYCLNHYPDVCENCEHICNPVKDKYDKLTTNKLYNINNLCQECSKESFLNYYRKNYSKDKVFINIEDDNKLEEILGTMNYEQFLINSKILNELKKVQAEQGLKDSEVKDFLCEKKYITKHFGIPEFKINEFTKWQIYRQITRTDELVKTFKDKIKYIKISQIRFRRMGYTQFQAFKTYLMELLYGEDFMLNEEYLKSIFEDIEEPDTAYPDVDVEDEEYDDICINCGTKGIIPGNTKCIKCKFVT